MRRLADEVTWMNAIRDGTMPLIKNTSWACPRCPYFEMCELHERNAQSYQEYKKLAYVVRDPYRDHRKSAGDE